MKVEVKSFGDSYELSAAVLIYTNLATRHALATKHEVQEHAGRPTIRPGAPFNEQDYKVLVEALAPAQQARMQWHDPRELARGLGRMLWWSPPMKRSLFFRRSPHNPRTFDPSKAIESTGSTATALKCQRYGGNNQDQPST